MMSTRTPPFSSEFQQVIDRLKEALGLPTNKAAAEALGLSPSNLGERKNRDALPRPQIEALCKARGVRLAWVFEGLLPVYESGGLRSQEDPPPYKRSLAPPLEMELMRACMEAVEVALEASGTRLSAERRARLVAAVYEFSLPLRRVNREAIPTLVTLASG